MMNDVGELIQISVAPVFLLVAIASFLNVVTNRLGRVVDRARDLEKILQAVSMHEHRQLYQADLRSLDKRMGYNHWSINFCSLSALLVTVLVSAIFIAHLNGADASFIVSTLFIAAMAVFLIGICFFLAEIYLATKTVRVRSELLLEMHDD